MTRPACTLAGCGRPHHGHGYCRPHHARWQRHGDPQAEVPIGRRAASGDGYWASHGRVHSARGPATGHSCAECGAAAAVWSYDGTDPDERTAPTRGCRYSLDPARYRPRCRSCHQKTTAEGRAARSAPELDVERAARLYAAGASLRGIGSLLRVSPGAVRAALRAHGGHDHPSITNRASTTDPETIIRTQSHPTPTDEAARTSRTRPELTIQDHAAAEKKNDQRSTTRTKDHDTNNDTGQSAPMHRDPTVGSASPHGPAEPKGTRSC